MESLCHVIEKTLCPSFLLCIAASISVPFFITFYSVKVVMGILTFDKSRLQKSLSFNKYSR